MSFARVGLENDAAAVSSTDIQRTAWLIAAKHLTAGQKDVTQMIEEGIAQERARCIELMKAALGPDADRAVFVANPDLRW
jgi:hypothetical protein